MKNLRKLQSKAFSAALVTHAYELALKSGLSTASASWIKQRAMVAAPHNVMESYKTNKLYATLTKAGEKNLAKIREIIED